MFMKKISKNEVLKICQNILINQGIGALNIRSVASHCQISIGSVYKLFESKNEMILDTVCLIWENMLIDFWDFDQINFLDCCQKLFLLLSNCNQKYSHFLNYHARLFGDKSQIEAKFKMIDYINKIKDTLLRTFNSDININKTNCDFELNKYIDFVYDSILNSVLKGEEIGDCFILILIEKLFY